jgi:hypothetical protein
MSIISKLQKFMPQTSLTKKVLECTCLQSCSESNGCGILEYKSTKNVYIMKKTMEYGYYKKKAKKKKSEKSYSLLQFSCSRHATPKNKHSSYTVE